MARPYILTQKAHTQNSSFNLTKLLTRYEDVPTQDLQAPVGTGKIPDDLMQDIWGLRMP